MQRTTFRAIAAGAALAGALACGDSANKPAAESASAAAPGKDFRADQMRYADSVLATVKGPGEVVKKLGKGYDVGSPTLRDTIAALAANARCFDRGRQTDPYLAGTATIWVNMSAIGSDLIQVQEPDSKWTSEAGNFVVACLNDAAKNWKFDPSFGKPGAYIVQVEFKLDPNAAPPAQKATGKKQAPAGPADG